MYTIPYLYNPVYNLSNVAHRWNIAEYS